MRSIFEPFFLPITFRSKYEGEERRGEGGGGVCVRVCACVRGRAFQNLGRGGMAIMRDGCAFFLLFFFFLDGVMDNNL